MLSSITDKYKESLARDKERSKSPQAPNLRPISDRKAFWETPEKVLVKTVYNKV